MTQMNLSFPPPQYWQDFEAIAVHVFREVWKDPHAELHGRSGQEQQGVDIFGHDRTRGSWIPCGVQCKRRRRADADGRYLNRDLRLAYQFYEDLLRKVGQYDATTHSLVLLRSAFRRPSGESSSLVGTLERLLLAEAADVFDRQ